MANKVYTNQESPILFEPGTAGDGTFTLTSLASGNGRVSDRYDRGSGARATIYEWRAKTLLATQGVEGQAIQIYIATSDGDIDDGNVGLSDAAFNDAARLNNLHFIGRIIVDDGNATPQPLHASGRCLILARYFSVVWKNATDDALSATGTDHQFILYPMPDEIQ